MTKPIRRVGVVGSGVMGSGIAAHMANAGLDVLLLDIVPRDLTEEQKTNKKARDRIAADNLAATKKARPALFFHPSHAGRVTVGNIDDDLAKLEGCDLVVEAIIENLKIKQAFFDKLDQVIDDDTIVASNTSGLRIVDMIEGRDERFRKNFLVMHFFNPVRYMKLLELVPGPETSDEVMARVAKLGRDMLGKGIVVGKDTPNFVGNRIGVHSMMTTIHQMVADGLTPEDVDAITGPPMGHPKARPSGPPISSASTPSPTSRRTVTTRCPTTRSATSSRSRASSTAWSRRSSSRQDARRLLQEEQDRDRDARPRDPRVPPEGRRRGHLQGLQEDIGKISDPAERLRKLVAADGKVGEFAWKVLSKSLAYAARRIGEITDDVDAVDDAMKWGYNWELGPFETWDALRVRRDHAADARRGHRAPRLGREDEGVRRVRLLPRGRGGLRPRQGRVRRPRGRPAERDVGDHDEGQRPGPRDRRRQGLRSR
ncbi:MAG: 3-hydroxyacyl-CoA dehydrogenase family protein [Sandaracinaceae bacterium]